MKKIYLKGIVAMWGVDPFINIANSFKYNLNIVRFLYSEFRLLGHRSLSCL